MPDTPAPPVPLDASPVTCWRCGGPTSQRSGLWRFDPCEVCQAMLQEVLARYQGRRPEPGSTPHGDTDG